MSNSNQNTPPPNNIIPFPLTGSKVIQPASRGTIPEELARLDGQPLACAKPEENRIIDIDAKVIPGKETANNVEFQLHDDGALMRYIERPGFSPQCILVDGVGRQFGIVRNAEVGELVCNGVNFLHMAKTMMDAEEKLKADKDNPGGPPPALLLPPTTS